MVPVVESVGVQLLQKMGWRPGRGIGFTTAKSAAAAAACTTNAAAAVAENARKTKKWGTVGGISLDNTPIYVLEPKQDVHGLGFDPFEGADEFREQKLQRKGQQQQQQQAQAGGRGAEKKRSRGVAFAAGALDAGDNDTYGYMDDYVQEDMPRDKQLLAFSFEEVSDEEADDDRCVCSLCVQLTDNSAMRHACHAVKSPVSADL